jgi:hypothetical protein
MSCVKSNLEEALNQFYEEQEGVSVFGWVAHSLDTIIYLALPIIGFLGACGIMPGSTFGWTGVGLGCGSLLLQLAPGNLKDRKITLLTGGLVASLVIVLAALGVANILTPENLWQAFMPIGCASAFGLKTIQCIGMGRHDSHHHPQPIQ